MGKALLSNSIIANSMEFLIPFGIGIKGGAPKANCRALAPTILALSNLVNFGGPISINLLFRLANSLSPYNQYQLI